ncbi:hypothetical protein Tco_1554336 [Tanacetum coccineum]
MSLIPPSKEVNTDDTADKSLSGTNVQPESSPSPQVIDTQPAEEPGATADATQSIDAFESAEKIRNHLKTADAEKLTVI